ncbi:MAG: hypothetical protein ING29_08590 [Azospirillum sp.]|nr:hypothetical protein [Azospirillum sp.]
MAKKMTLTDKAQRLAKTQVSEMAHPHTAFMVGYLAGHRANRLTRAERAILKEAVGVARHCKRYGTCPLDDLMKLVAAYERAKGGAR